MTLITRMACIDEKMAISSMFIVSRSLYCILPIENTKEFKSFRIVCSIYGQPSSYLYRMIYIAYVTAAEDIGSSSKAVSC